MVLRKAHFWVGIAGALVAVVWAQHLAAEWTSGGFEITGRTVQGVAVLGALAPVEATGQTGCWDVNGDAISCSGTGQDGDLLRGVDWPNPRFTDNGDGTVRDHLTGLVWLKNANCFGPRTWMEALSDANSLADGQCGLSDASTAGDWVLPNAKELLSLADYQNVDPALPTGQPFANVQLSDYWNSTTAQFRPAALFIQASSFQMFGTPKTETSFVWPVGNTAIFSDGFESGDTSAWSLTFPNP